MGIRLPRPSCIVALLVIWLGAPAELPGQDPPTAGDGEYVLTFSPPFQFLDISGRAFALMADQGVISILFCRPETSLGGGSIAFTHASRNDFITGEWTVGSGSSTPGVRTLVDSRDRSTGAVAAYGDASRMGRQGTLTMRGFQDGFLVGSLIADGDGRLGTSKRDPVQPVRVALSFRARPVEVNPPDC